jgi:Ca2+-binding EF-hand superfamily protein
LLSRNNGHFKRLDSNNDGQIDTEEFNARLIAMFNRMDVNGDGLLSAEEMPKRHHGGHHHRDHDDDHDNKYRHSS